MSTANSPNAQFFSRRSWADLCRVIAIFGIIVIHSCGSLAFYQYQRIAYIDWMSANFFESLVRCSVPLFVMLSGALLLKYREEPITVFQIAKRVKRVLIPLLTWNVGYLMYVSHYTGLPIDWLSMLSTPPMYHLWFVYMIIGIYLLLPVFQILFQLVYKRNDLKIYILTFWIVVTCLPIYWPIPLLTLIQQSSFFGYGGYFIIGGILGSSKQTPLPTWTWFFIYFISVIVTFILTVLLSKQTNSAVETAYMYFSPNVFVSSIAAFVLFTRAQISEPYTRYLAWIGDKSFLIFFMHVVVLERLKYSNTLSIINQHVPLFLTILLISCSTFIISLMIAAVMRVIPGSKIILG